MIGIGLTKRLITQGTNTGPDPGGPQSVQDDRKSVTLGNSKLSGFAMQELYKVVTGNINAARIRTLHSDEDDNESVRQLEDYGTSLFKGCSMLTRYWNTLQKPGYGMDVILEAFNKGSQLSSGPQTGDAAVKYDRELPENASPAPELLANLLNTGITDRGYDQLSPDKGRFSDEEMLQTIMPIATDVDQAENPSALLSYEDRTAAILDRVSGDMLSPCM